MNSAKGTPKSDLEVATDQDHHRGVGSALRQTFGTPAGVTSAPIEALIDQLDQLD
jgi:hypothetical protein